MKKDLVVFEKVCFGYDQNNLFLDNQLIVDTILHWIEVYEKDCKRTTVNLLDEILEEREEAMYILSSILEK